MTAPDPSPAATALDEIRALIAARDDLAARINWDDPASIREFNAAQDKLAARVPRLAAAVGAVLEKADEWEASSDTRPLVTRGYAAECFRAAIIRELTGEEAGDGETE